jgi:hypothetical protein
MNKWICINNLIQIILKLDIIKIIWLYKIYIYIYEGKNISKNNTLIFLIMKNKVYIYILLQLFSLFNWI